jgi:hypothetical protein
MSAINVSLVARDVCSEPQWRRFDYYGRTNNFYGNGFTPPELPRESWPQTIILLHINEDDGEALALLASLIDKTDAFQRCFYLMHVTPVSDDVAPPPDIAIIARDAHEDFMRSPEHWERVRRVHMRSSKEGLSIATLEMVVRQHKRERDAQRVILASKEPLDNIASTMRVLLDDADELAAAVSRLNLT